MRTQTFISSMVLSVACVSAANAAVVDPFTVASSATDGAGTVTETPITGGLWDTRYSKVDYRTNITNRATASLVVDASTNAATFTVTRVNAANNQNDQSGALEYDGTTDVSNFTSLTFNYTSTFSALLFEIDLGGKIATKTISASAGGTFTLLASELVASGDPSGYMNLVFRQDNSNASGTFTMTNLVANGISVPAPGAAALIGLAGLVASRRRRN